MIFDTAVGIYDDDARMFTPRDMDGELGEPRPYDDEENANADSRAEYSSQQGNEATLREQVAQQVPALLASIEALRVIAEKSNASIGPADTKAVAREARAVARALVRVVRIVGGVLDSTDAG